MPYFQKPTAGKVNICNMTDSLHNMDVDVLLLRMKSKQYHDLRVPIQNSGYNCGVMFSTMLHVRHVMPL
eukprot:13041830-Ditylum_brightwellii.AAC.1